MVTKEEVASQVGALPTLPEVLGRLMALFNDPRAMATDFEEVIAIDAGLSSNVLRVVNSAAFGVRAKISSVAHAVSLLGLQRIHEIVASASYRSMIPRWLPGYGIKARDFWAHNAASAVIASKLSDGLRLTTHQNAFTAGLLHDCGKLAIATFLSKKKKWPSLKAENGTDPLDAERRAIGTDHCEVGGELVRRWQLPPDLEFIAMWHHQPLNVPDDSHRRLIAAVHVASSVTYPMGFGADATEVDRPVDPEVYDILGLSAEAVNEITKGSLTEIQKLVQVLG
ncbi:MAG: HDOD domain-containing protein [Polyangiaceae bacterium]|nr:HDOD domain-containing protein [Polyangiaceae bacterium]